MSDLEKQILDTYNSLSDKEILQLTPKEIAEFTRLAELQENETRSIKSKASAEQMNADIIAVKEKAIKEEWPTASKLMDVSKGLSKWIPSGESSYNESLSAGTWAGPETRKALELPVTLGAGLGLGAAIGVGAKALKPVSTLAKYAIGTGEGAVIGGGSTTAGKLVSPEEIKLKDIAIGTGLGIGFGVGGEAIKQVAGDVFKQAYNINPEIISGIKPNTLSSLRKEIEKKLQNLSKVTKDEPMPTSGEIKKAIDDIVDGFKGITDDERIAIKEGASALAGVPKSLYSKQQDVFAAEDLMKKPWQTPEDLTARYQMIKGTSTAEDLSNVTGLPGKAKQIQFAASQGLKKTIEESKPILEKMNLQQQLAKSKAPKDYYQIFSPSLYNVGRTVQGGSVIGGSQYGLDKYRKQ